MLYKYVMRWCGRMLPHHRITYNIKLQLGSIEGSLMIVVYRNM